MLALIGPSEARRAALTNANQPIPPPVRINALIDTGASCTCVDAAVLAPLALTPTGSSPVSTPTTGQQAITHDVYDITLFIPGPTGGEGLMFGTIPVVALNDFGTPAYEALIGRDVLSQCILHYNGALNLFTLAY